MNLTEVAYNARDEKLDYLAEYLIQSPTKLTLTEAKELIYLIEKSEKKAKGKLVAASKEKLAKKYEALKTSLGKLKGKLSPKQYLAKSRALKADYALYRHNLINANARNNSFIGKTAGKLKDSVAAAYKIAPKSTVGLGIAGGLGAAGGLAAYVANKKRKEALAAKK